MYVFNINYKCGMYNVIFSDYLLLSLSGCRVGCLKYATDQQRGSKEFDKVSYYKCTSFLILCKD